MQSTLARVVVDKEVAAKADEAFFAELQRSPSLEQLVHNRRLDLTDPLQYPLRKVWIDLYEKFGGTVCVIHVCARGRAVRVVPIEVDPTIAEKVDRILQERHPELGSKKLEQEMPRDPGARKGWCDLRNEWLDIFETLGGETVVIAGLETNTPVRVPKT